MMDWLSRQASRPSNRNAATLLDALPHPEAEHNYYVGDWLLVAPSATADTFGAIAPRLAAFCTPESATSVRAV